MAIITLGSHLAKVQTPRAAVVPYIVKEGELFFLLGQDRQSGDITDLGGGVKQYESTLAAALRELDEESDEILGSLKPNDFSCSVALLDNQMGVLFIPLSKRWYVDAPKLFNSKKGTCKKKSHTEIKQLIWFNEKDFQELIRPNSQNSSKMWKRLRGFYHRNFTDKLKNALQLTYNRAIVS